MATLVESAATRVATVVDPDDVSSVVGVCVALRLFAAGETVATSVITGGITNRLFRVKGPSKSVLVRVYGGEGLIDRDVETATFAALCEHLKRPSLLGRFANGRCEEFLEDHATLDLDGMRTHAPAIARALRHLHAFRVPPHLAGHHGECALWATMADWKARAFAAGALDALRARDPAAAGILHRHRDVFDGPVIDRTLAKLRSCAPPCAGTSRVFAHNDLLSGNLMRDGSTGEMRIIDLEYGGINYAAFDVANHFMEWAGGTGQASTALGVPDYARLPSDAERLAWVGAYLGGDGKLRELTDFLAQVDLFMIVDNLYWGLWACCQSLAEGDAEFPYLVYAKSRLRRGLIDANALDAARSPEYGLDRASLGSTPKTADGARRLYDDWASSYDAVLRSWGYTAPEACARLLEEALPPDRRGALFDCGCGTGLAVAALKGATFARIVGADVSRASLDLCERRGYTATLEADLEKPLPLDDASFDAILCVGVLSYVSDFARLFSEWCRVASPGAVVVFTHWTALWEGGDGASAAADALAATGAWTRTFLGDARPYMPNNPDGDERAKTITVLRFTVN